MEFNHCEPSPWRILEDNDDLYIIDAEWSTDKYPEHYDLAHTVARIGTAYKNPEKAKKFLEEYKTNPSEKEKQYFDDTIQGLIAIRVIEELRDATLAKKRRIMKKQSKILKKP